MSYEAMPASKNTLPTNACVKTWSDSLIEVRSCCIPMWRFVLRCFGAESVEIFENLVSYAFTSEMQLSGVVCH